MQRQILAAAAYPVIVFPLALVWHLGLFNDRYVSFGYFDGAPNIAVGLATMVIQGAVLAVLYPLFRLNGAGIKRPIKFAGLMGTFFWTSHVLAMIAKQNVPQAGAFILMESVYLCLQFGLFALALGFIFREERPTWVTSA